MPDSPRPSISFPAFQTPAGLHPQADREHRSDYSETQGQTRELSRRTDGYWLDLPYSPDRYHADAPPAVLTVNKSDLITARYRVVGATLDLNIYFQGAVTVGPAGYLAVQLPERLVTRQLALAMTTAAAGAALGHGLCQTAKGQRFVAFYNVGFAGWPIGAVRTGGQITIEVEEL